MGPNSKSMNFKSHILGSFFSGLYCLSSVDFWSLHHIQGGTNIIPTMKRTIDFCKRAHSNTLVVFTNIFFILMKNRKCPEYVKVQLTLVISTSLISNNRLSRSEIWFLPKHKNQATGKKYCGKEEKLLLLLLLFLLFSTIFLNISLTSRVQLHIYLLNVVVLQI